MRKAGRPLRFLLVTLGGWTAARVVVLWPIAAVPVAPSPPMLAAAGGTTAFDTAQWLAEPVDRSAIAPWPALRDSGAAVIAHRAPTAMPVGHAAAAPDRRLVALALAAMVRYGDAVPAGEAGSSDGAIPPPLRPTPIAKGRSRLAGSTWGIARGGGGGTLLGGQLGASQEGVRLTYALDAARRVAVSARFATPLRGRGKEAAFGVDWQPTRAPLHLLAEQRVSLDGARGGPTLLAIGGIPPTSLLAGFRLEGYGEAGAIKRDGVETFGDGAVRVTRKLAAIGPVAIDLGGGAWGAGQRGVRRLDLGPTIGAAVPIASRSLRMTLDWRERIAGNARPGSGPALSIGTDF